jgi:hypothetical protein
MQYFQSNFFPQIRIWAYRPNKMKIITVLIIFYGKFYFEKFAQGSCKNKPVIFVISLSPSVCI